MVRNAVELGYERTVEQHAAFEFRQLAVDREDPASRTSQSRHCRLASTTR
jgi:uncharacterized membrane protein